MTTATETVQHILATYTTTVIGAGERVHNEGSIMSWDNFLHICDLLPERNRGCFVAVPLSQIRGMDTDEQTPVNETYVRQMANMISVARKLTDDTYNGLIEPIRTILIDGEIHIANGFHRVAAYHYLIKHGQLPEELDLHTIEDRPNDPYIFCYVEPGDQAKLWELRLYGLGRKEAVKPARIAGYLLNAWIRMPWGEVGFDVAVSIAELLLREPPQQAKADIQIKDASESQIIDVNIMREAVEKAKLALQLTGMDPETARKYHLLSKAVAPDIILRTRLQERKNTIEAIRRPDEPFEIPFTVAHEMQRSRVFNGNFALQRALVAILPQLDTYLNRRASVAETIDLMSRAGQLWELADTTQELIELAERTVDLALSLYKDRDSAEKKPRQKKPKHRTAPTHRQAQVTPPTVASVTNPAATVDQSHTSPGEHIITTDSTDKVTKLRELLIQYVAERIRSQTTETANLSYEIATVWYLEHKDEFISQDRTFASEEEAETAHAQQRETFMAAMRTVSDAMLYILADRKEDLTVEAIRTVINNLAYNILDYMIKGKNVNEYLNNVIHPEIDTRVVRRSFSSGHPSITELQLQIAKMFFDRYTNQ